MTLSTDLLTFIQKMIRETFGIDAEIISAAAAAEQNDNLILPIRLRGKIVGAVACRTPLEPAAEASIRMFLEMLDRYESDRGGLTAGMNVTADLVTRLFFDDAEKFGTDIEMLAAQLGYKITHPMAVVAARLTPKYNYCFNVNLGYEIASEEAKRGILDAVARHPYFNRQDIPAFIKDDYFIIIKSIEEINDLPRLYQMMGRIQVAADEILRNYPIFDYYISYGKIVESYRNVSESFREAAASITIAQTLAFAQPVVTPEDVLLPSLLSGLSQEFIVKYIRPGVDAFHRENPETVHGLLQCFDHFSNSGFQIAATSAALFLHRNTIRKRLARLRRLTGMDPAGDFTNVLVIKLIEQQYYLEKKPLL